MYYPESHVPLDILHSTMREDDKTLATQPEFDAIPGNRLAYARLENTEGGRSVPVLAFPVGERGDDLRAYVLTPASSA